MNDGVRAGNHSMLAHRANDLQDQIKEIDLEAARLRRQREEAVAELADVEVAVQASSTKWPRPAPAPRDMEPRRWQLCSEVQADVAAKRAVGQLLSYGAPGRVPRVYVDGCFDMMHSGHMNALRQAKLIAESLGGVLVVGVHADAEIKANKGPPVMRDAERLALTAAVKWVDVLVFDTPYSATLPFLDSIDAECVVHGDDISIDADGTDAYAEAKHAGRMKVIKRTEGVSTTDLVGRLLLLTREHHAPAMSSPRAAGDAARLGTPLGGAAPSAPPAPPALSAPSAPPAAPSAPPPAAASYTSANISSCGVSQFLPTTWRLRQFSNGRVAGPGETIVYVDGAFDLLHAGHVDALYAARNLGDFLLVGLHDDATVNARGQNQPICSLHERALCLLALGCVDDVILGAPPVVSADLIRSMNIGVVIGDADAPSDEPVRSPGGSPGRAPAADRYAVPRERGLFRSSEHQNPLRMADIVMRIIDNRTRFEARNLKREKKELNYVLHEKAYVEEL